MLVREKLILIIKTGCIYFYIIRMEMSVFGIWRIIEVFFGVFMFDKSERKIVFFIVW